MSRKPSPAHETSLSTQKSSQKGNVDSETIKTTHRSEGINIKDVEMAAWCDEQARIHKEELDVELEPLNVFDFVENASVSRFLTPNP
ncbi:hypothetical protein ABVK25_005293 [Lepraria finkii]|uniref:Uncharacterized protein n=1 Tax=Lepraria finkii TaxID=1340010 RepID=A0ABR4B9P7_9LECA